MQHAKRGGHAELKRGGYWPRSTPSQPDVRPSVKRPRTPPLSLEDTTYFRESAKGDEWGEQEEEDEEPTLLEIYLPEDLCHRLLRGRDDLEDHMGKLTLRLIREQLSALLL